MAYFQIMTIAIFLTGFALWKMNLLLSIVSSAMWFAMLAFHLANRPSNVAQGSPTDGFIILALVGVALAMPILTLMQEKYRKESGGRSWFSTNGNDRKNHENGHAESSGRISHSSDERPRGPLDLSVDEYKAYLRSRVRNRRR